MLDAMQWAIFTAAFLAAGVEWVEAFTLVLAASVSTNRRSAIVGALLALAVLALLIVTLGVALVTLVPLEVLRFVIGFLLLLFGLKWLKDAIQRYTGLKRKRDEEAVFLSNVDTAPARPSPEESIDSFGVLLAFKGVLLEGLEGAFVAISFAGGGMGALAAASLGVASAAVVVITVGTFVQAPLRRIPENTLKFVVGILLTAYGTFWAGESYGIEWPLADLALVLLGLGYFFASAILITTIRNRTTEVVTEPVP